MGAPIVLSIFTGMVLTRSIAPNAVLLLTIASAALCLIGGRIARWERLKPRPLPLVKLATALCVPGAMSLAGAAFAVWMKFDNYDPRLIVAAELSFSAIISAILVRRPMQMCASVGAMWVPVVLADGSTQSFFAMATVAAVMAITGYIRVRMDQSYLLKTQEDQRARDRYQDILRDYEDTGQGWFWETDRRGQIAYVSPTVAAALGKKNADLLGKPFLELFDLINQGDENERTLTFHISARSSFQELAMRAASSDEERWWSVSGRPIYDDFHNFVGFRGSGTDLTEIRRSQKNESRLAHYDSLTGLANRFQMSQTLGKILSAPQEMQRECAVFLLDLDRFKHVNDTMGHPAGDAMLKQVAQRLERVIGERGRVGRLGGDEFKVIIAGRVEQADLAQLAHEIIYALSQPYSIEGQRAVIGASIGIAVSPDDGVHSEALIRNADLALYAAKGGGRGRYHFYSGDLHSAAQERSKMEQDLRDAISQNLLELHYQPVVSTATEKITGFEALLRWNHPTQGWMSPAKFIPIAEEAGLISAIGEWAIRTACQDLARWPDDIRCAVNVSPLQFANGQLPVVVAQALAHAGIAANRLELEITESVFLNDSLGTDAMFAALKGIGVRLALDDFGTGYSSLGYLKKAPFDKIKIDQSFVRGATQQGSRNGAIIAAITSLAQALGMDTTAEGVETLDELDLVRLHGCSHVQGFIYDPALTCEAATARVEGGRIAEAQGPRSARSPRQTMLRKVVLEHEGQFYNGTIRNISEHGVMIEGLWNVPPGTLFQIAMSETHTVAAISRWGQDDRMGVEFSKPLERDVNGGFLAIKGAGPNLVIDELRRRG